MRELTTFEKRMAWASLGLSVVALICGGIWKLFEATLGPNGYLAKQQDKQFEIEKLDREKEWEAYSKKVDFQRDQAFAKANLVELKSWSKTRDLMVVVLENKGKDNATISGITVLNERIIGGPVDPNPPGVEEVARREIDLSKAIIGKEAPVDPAFVVKGASSVQLEITIPPLGIPDVQFIIRYGENETVWTKIRINPNAGMIPQSLLDTVPDPFGPAAPAAPAPRLP